MQKLVKVVSLFFTTVVAVSFSVLLAASPIVVNDGDQFSCGSGGQYLITGVLSSSNPQVTYGANVDPGNLCQFTVTAPVGLNLSAAIYSGPNFTGNSVLKPNSFNTVYAGTSFDFPIDGDVLPGQPQWLSVGIGPESYSLVDALPGGELSVDGFMSSTDESFDFDGGQSPGDGGGVNLVPIPSTLPLLGLGLLGLLARRRRQTV